MKKVLFLMLAVAISMTGFAQKNVQVSKDIKNAEKTALKRSALRISDDTQAQSMSFASSQTSVVSSRSMDDFEEFETMYTHYDLQSNSALGNRIAVWPDGTASVAITWDYSGNTSWPDRGTGYNYYDGSDFGEAPEARQESVKSGWPSITACGNGEVLASHASGVNVYYRPTKGTGEWTLIANYGSEYGNPTWPRVAVSGPNSEYIHVVMCKQIGSAAPYDNHIYYSRITRNGDSWEVSPLIDFPGIDNDAAGEYRNQLSADDYVMAANGNNVAVMMSAYTTEVFYMISHDNGENWERQIIAPYPIADENGNCVHAVDFDDFPEGMTDTISTSDGSHSIAIDNNGVVHAAFGLFHWRVTDADHYTYYPAGYFGIVYWNSNYINELGGHEILPFGQSSIDINHPEWIPNGLGWTLEPDRIEELAALNGQEANLHLFGYVDENGNGTLDYDNVLGASWHYRTYGLATLPGVSVDNHGNVAIIFSVWSETRVSALTNFSYRSAYVTCRNHAGDWFDDAINLGEDPMHMLDEVYPTTASPVAYNGSFWMYYSADLYQGLFLDIDAENYPNSNNGEISDNILYAVKVTPSMPGWVNVAETEAVNPMTTTRVYPTPTNGVLNVEVNASQNSDVNISVFNIMGQKVSEQNSTVSTGINTKTISTDNLSSGIYFVTVKANGYENTMKFVVE